MEQQLSDFYENLNQLSDYLGDGSDNGWTHEIKKQILLLLHALKNESRKFEIIEVESELMALEKSLGYGAGENNAVDVSQIEEHQLRLMELAEPTSEPILETNIEENEEDSTDCEVVDKSIDDTSDSILELDHNETYKVEEQTINQESDDIAIETKVSTPIQLMLCNCPGRDAARELAQGLVKARLAACVNIIANIGAIYWWEGEIKDTAECQLQIKTSNQSIEDVIQYIKQHHPSDVPEIIGMKVNAGNQDYFEWVKQETYDRE